MKLPATPTVNVIIAIIVVIGFIGGLFYLTSSPESYMLVEVRFHDENKKILIAEVDTETLKTHYGISCSKDIYELNFYGDRTTTPRVFFSNFMAPMGKWSTLQGTLPALAGKKTAYLSMRIPAPLPYTFEMTMFADKNARDKATERRVSYYNYKNETLSCVNVPFKK